MAERKSLLLRLDPAVHDALARWARDEIAAKVSEIEDAKTLAGLLLYLDRS